MTNPPLPTRRCLLGGLAATVAAVGMPSRLAARPTISGPEALADALSSAALGVVLRLAPGQYGGLNLRRFKGAPGAPVTLIADDRGRPPRFQAMDLRDVAHLVLDGLQFDYNFAPSDNALSTIYPGRVGHCDPPLPV